MKSIEKNIKQALSCYRHSKNLKGAWINFLKSSMYYFLPHNMKSSVVNFYPITLTIYVNTKCNYSCSFCYLAGKTNSVADLSIEDFFKIIYNQFNKYAYRITLGGGEPFLHENLFFFITELKKNKKQVTVYTNGSLLAQNLDNLNAAKLDNLCVSHYDDKFDSIVEIIKFICKQKGYPSVWLSKIITNKNYSCMEEIVEIAIQNFIPYLVFKNYFPSDGENHDLIIYSTNSAYWKEHSRLKRKYRKAPIQISWLNVLDQEGSYNCQNLGLNIIYGPAGNIAPCCFIVPPSGLYGNLFASKNIWNSNAMVSLRQGESELCNYCYFKHGLKNRIF